jgi:hypothetical protein
MLVHTYARVETLWPAEVNHQSDPEQIRVSLTAGEEMRYEKEAQTILRPAEPPALKEILKVRSEAWNSDGPMTRNVFNGGERKRSVGGRMAKRSIVDGIQKERARTSPSREWLVCSSGHLAGRHDQGRVLSRSE